MTTLSDAELRAIVERAASGVAIGYWDTKEIARALLDHIDAIAKYREEDARWNEQWETLNARAKSAEAEVSRLGGGRLTVDKLWDALREVSCATKPFTEAKAIVLLHRDDVERAFQRLTSESLPAKALDTAHEYLTTEQMLVELYASASEPVAAAVRRGEPYKDISKLPLHAIRVSLRLVPLTVFTRLPPIEADKGGAV